MLDNDILRSLVQSVIQKTLVEDYSQPDEAGENMWDKIAEMVKEENKNDMVSKFSTKSREKLSTGDSVEAFATDAMATDEFQEILHGQSGLSDEVAFMMTQNILEDKNLCARAMMKAAGYEDMSSFLDEFFDEELENATALIDTRSEVLNLTAADKTAIKQQVEQEIRNMKPLARADAEDNLIEIIGDIFVESEIKVEGKNLLVWLQDEVQKRILEDDDMGVKKMVKTVFESDMVKNKIYERQQLRWSKLPNSIGSGWGGGGGGFGNYG